MGDIRVRRLSQLIKVEREHSPSDKDSVLNYNQFPDHRPYDENVKFEKLPELECKIKVESKVDVDINENKFFPINDVQEEKSMLVLQLMKRTTKIQQCMCERCGAICDSKRDLSLHQSQYHRIRITPSLIGCIKCSKRFPTYRLRHHHMFIHRNISPFVCKYCNKCFTTVRKADHHSRCAHLRFGTTPSFVCRKCYMCFHHVKSYERHLYVHSYQFKCTICFRRFRHLKRFHEHLTETHFGSIQKKYQEDKISECFTVKSDVSQLIKEEPNYMDSTVVADLLKCERCTESFGCKDSFLVHMESHMKCLKRFHCLHCHWVYFSSQRTLDRHTKKCHPDVGQLEDDENSSTGSMDKENKENATNSSEEVVGNGNAKATGNESSNKTLKEISNSQTLDCQSGLVVDEVGDVDMSGFEELIKQFLS